MSDVQMLPLGLIHDDQRCWPRVRRDEERVEDLARMYADEGPLAVPPVRVVALLSGKFLLVDGRHRCAARRLMNAPDVAAVLVEHGSVDPLTFAYDFALADSARSALPLTRAEKQRAVIRLITEHPERTDVAIAQLVGVSSKTVQRARRQAVEHPHGPDEPDQPAAVRSPTADDVARALVRHLDRMWSARPLRMAVGVQDSARLGELIADAFIDRFGEADAVRWTERMRTWATRAHAVAVQAAREAPSESTA